MATTGPNPNAPEPDPLPEQWEASAWTRVEPPTLLNLRRSTAIGIAAIAEAMAAAQGEIEHASKDRENPHFRSRYATLASVWDACRAALSKHKIAVVQGTATEQNGDVSVTTLLAHASGQWIESTLSARPTKQDAQGIGSAITYLRRYSLAAMVGVAPDDDEDDGNAAVGRGPAPAAARDVGPPPRRPPAAAKAEPQDPEFEARKAAVLARAQKITVQCDHDKLDWRAVWKKHNAPGSTASVNALNLPSLEAAVKECEGMVGQRHLVPDDDPMQKGLL